MLSIRKPNILEFSRTVSEDYKRDENPVDFQENAVRTEMLPKMSEETSRTVVDVTVVKGDESESLNKLSNSNGLEKENSMDINLERALESRAQVIGSFEGMEETQKEWEKKFRENKSSSLVCFNVSGFDLWKILRDLIHTCELVYQL